jgi:tripartite-type tricarboxylate transporter receptor subunit TctC
VTKGPLVLLTHPSLEVNSVADLIALAKQRPGALDYGSGGTGSSPHLAAEMFKQQAGASSSGYRPGRSAIDAVRTARQRCWRYDWVLDIET